VDEGHIAVGGFFKVRVEYQKVGDKKGGNCGISPAILYLSTVLREEI